MCNLFIKNIYFENIFFLFEKLQNVEIYLRINDDVDALANKIMIIIKIDITKEILGTERSVRN